MADAQSQMINAAVPITARTPKPMVTAERRINFPSLKAKPKARLRMGSISGATIMAPITTAVLLEISPSGDHRRADQKNEKTKRWLG